MSKKNGGSSSTNTTISLPATITASSGGAGGSGDGSSSSGSEQQPQPQPKKPRTIQVKIGNQAAKEMTPDQAADYLRLLATAGAAAAATAGGGGGGSGRGNGGALMPQQVKMTFQNGTTETVPLTTGGSSSATTSISMSGGIVGTSSTVGGGSGNSNFFRKSSKRSGNSNTSDLNNSITNNGAVVGVGGGGVNNMPCTEKEMKALMSMFVEIMGLQMNTDKLNKQQYKGGKKKKKTDASTDDDDHKTPAQGSADSDAAQQRSNKDKKHLFHFPADLPPPPGGWPQDLLWPNGCGIKKKLSSDEEGDDDDDTEDSYEYDDDDSPEDLASLPELEEIPLDVRQKAATAAALSSKRTAAALAEAAAEEQRNGSNTATTSAANTYPHTLFAARKTGLVAGIAVPEWEALERVAMEEALEQEERARKSSKAAASSSSTAASLSTSFLRSTVMEALTTSSAVSASSSSSSAAVAAAAAAACASSTSGGGVTSTAASRATGAAAVGHAAAARKAALATAALKRRAKAAQVWRTKVIAACQSCDTPTLDRLLKEDSDLRKQLEKQEKESSNTNNSTDSNASNTNTSSSSPSLSSPTCNDADPTAPSATFDALLPYCLPNTKNHRASLIKTRETRQRLARHLLSICPSRLAKQPLRNNGRTVLHMACMYGDFPLVKQILLANNNSNHNSSTSTTSNSKKPPLPTSSSSTPTPNNHDNGLDFPCQDSGWTPLHYAALSGSMQTMELLLSKGASLSAVTDDVHTWWSSTSKGLTPKQLVDVVASGKGEKQVETHGMALSEITKEFLNTSSSSDNGVGVDDATTTTAATTTETRKYLAWLQRISQRLETLERAKKKNPSNPSYYTEPSKKEMCDWFQEKVQEPTIVAVAATATSSSSITAPAVAVVDETTRANAVQVKAASKAAPAPPSSSESSSNKNKDDSSESGSGTEHLAPTSTASNNNQNESKKRIKKKKKKGTDNNDNSATEISPSLSVNAAVFTATEDPLVTALKGMGFAEKHILAGIQACGGANRATPDMIVAWIFEQESGGGGGALEGNAATVRSSSAGGSKKKDAPVEFTQQKKRGNDTKASSSNKPTSSASSSVSSSQRQQEKPTVAAAATKKIHVAKPRESDDKLAADRLLAVKREEQRRRNREWNKKQEAQRVELVTRSSVVSNNSASSATNGRAPSPAPALMTGLPAAMVSTTTHNAAAARASSSAPTATSFKQPPPGLASMPQTASMSTMPVAEITTDASTIASSVGDLFNDDATISTIGSRTTNTQHSILQTISNNGGNSAIIGLPYHHHHHHHHQQVLQSQSQQHVPVAPPGFGPSVAAVPESVPVADETWHQASLGLGQRLYAPPGSSIGGAAAPHFVDQRAQASSMTAASMGSLQSRMSAAHEAFAGGFTAPRAPNNVATKPHLSSSLSGSRGIPVGSSAFGPCSLFHHQSMPDISDPSNFAANSSSTLGSHMSMDSPSLIESMATGSAPIGGASLWGGSHHDHLHGQSVAGSSLLGGPHVAPLSVGGAGGGSSLLDNLIQTNNHQVDSLFSFDNQRSPLGTGWGENANNPNNNFGGNSNTNNRAGIGGHPMGGDGPTSNHQHRGSHGNIW